MIPDIRLGYACLNVHLRDLNIFCSRSLIIKSLKEKGIDIAKNIALLNINDLHSVLLNNLSKGIYLFRITSNLFPHIGNPKVKNFNYTIDFARPLLKKIGDFAKDNHIRLTMHIGQYAQIASQTQEVINQTIVDLIIHSDILDAMGLDMNSVNVIHVGGGYGDKRTTIERFIRNFNLLPNKVKDRLVIENDDVIYDAEDVLYICESINRPMVFDVHHHELNKCKTDINILMPRILKTWSKLKLKPKFHLSEQHLEKRVGSHSDYVEKIPNLFLELPSKYGIQLDIMIEAKQKDLAVDKLHKKYFEKTNDNGIIIWTPKYQSKQGTTSAEIVDASCDSDC